MKYRGVELKVGDYSQSELCIGIEYTTSSTTLQEVLNLIFEKFADFSMNNYYFEDVLPNYTLLRNHVKFTFDEIGIENLKFVYDLLQDIPQIDVCVEITADDWFEIDAETYNSDSVDWDNFIKNLKL